MNRQVDAHATRGNGGVAERPMSIVRYIVLLLATFVTLTLLAVVLGRPPGAGWYPFAGVLIVSTALEVLRRHWRRRRVRTG